MTPELPMALALGSTAWVAVMGQRSTLVPNCGCALPHTLPHQCHVAAFHGVCEVGSAAAAVVGARGIVQRTWVA